MHGTRRSILEAQAASGGLPLIQVPLPWPCSNAVYEKCMREAVASMLAQGVSVVAFGDLFLQDVRQYRERQLDGSGLRPIFPLWRLPTRALMEEMIGAGVRASITCLDPKKMPREFAGRELTLDLLDGLPSDVDPCGENGEFHTVVHAGPMFRAPIELTAGEIVERDGFVFADFISQSSVTV
jgi:diphthamide synthase (EF-2-diphthine--ammonia ligase)